MSEVEVLDKKLGELADLLQDLLIHEGKDYVAEEVCSIMNGARCPGCNGLEGVEGVCKFPSTDFCTLLPGYERQ